MRIILAGAINVTLKKESDTCKVVKWVFVDWVTINIVINYMISGCQHFKLLSRVRVESMYLQYNKHDI